MRLPTLVFALSVAAFVPALAAPPAPLPPAPPPGTGLPTGQCFRTQDIQNHRVADNRTLLIATRNRATFRVTMSGSCLAAAMPDDPIITRSPPGSPIVCKPIDLDIALSKGGFASPCIVESIVRLSPEETAALPARLKP